MTNEQAINILFNEQKCIDRNDGVQCNRECGSCDLVMDVETIREVYNMAISALQAQDVPDTNVDTIDRAAAIDAYGDWYIEEGTAEGFIGTVKQLLEGLPSAEPEQRYTEEELRVFAHGISLSLLSKRSAQHWQYDKDTATEIEFLERLYEKVCADMRGDEDE